MNKTLLEKNKINTCFLVFPYPQTFFEYCNRNGINQNNRWFS